jgi:hypothetical protein
MLKNKIFNLTFIKIFLISIILNIPLYSFAEIIILSGCQNNKDTFAKNEYVIDLDKSLMTRNFIYDDKTYKKYRLTDINTQKNNSVSKFIYEENNLILSDKVGYPQFYTQLLFERNNLEVKIKTVINNEPGTYILSKCTKIEIFDKES